MTMRGEGWFPTRDAGSIDKDGFLFLEGRAEDVIVRGGENMSPGEIEDVLLEHETVDDVAVVGILDEQWGEGVVATVVLKAGKNATDKELQNWVKDCMRSSQIPQLIQFWDELSYNETGKLLRRVVNARLSAESDAPQALTRQIGAVSRRWHGNSLQMLLYVTVGEPRECLSQLYIHVLDFSIDEGVAQYAALRVVTRLRAGVQPHIERLIDREK